MRRGFSYTARAPCARRSLIGGRDPAGGQGPRPARAAQSSGGSREANAARVGALRLV